MVHYDGARGHFCTPSLGDWRPPLKILIFDYYILLYHYLFPYWL